MNFGGALHFNKGVICGIFAFLIIVIVLYKSGNSEVRELSENLKHKQAVNLKELLSIAIEASIRGGSKVYEVRVSQTLNEKSKGKTKEGANNPVTDGDMKSHIEMFYSIQKAFPFIKIRSEEKPAHENDAWTSVKPASRYRNDELFKDLLDEYAIPEDIIVWIDPLDATKEYTENLIQYVTTMVCIAVKGKPIIGVIHQPFLNATTWAWVSHKFYSSNVTPYKNSNIPDKPRIIVSRSHKGEVEKTAKASFGDAAITEAGGAGFKSLQVINGTQDVYIHTSAIKKWDICAGNAILNHLHGKMTTLSGDEILYKLPDQYKVESGLLATMYNHDYYVKKLKTS